MRTGFRSTAVVVIAYAIAMGFLEATVVAYLAAALGQNVPFLPFAAPEQPLSTFLAIEGAREFATLVMIAAVGWLAGRTGLERLSWAAVIFGVWDIVYYVGLRLLEGWPPSLTTWDVLFLLPSKWVGPVWAPVVVSLTLIGGGLAVAAKLRAGRHIAVRRANAFAVVSGGVMVVVSFLLDADEVLSGRLTTWTGWWIFVIGMGLGVAAVVGALRPIRDRQPDPT